MMRRTIWKKALAAFLAVSMMALTSGGAQDSGSASSEASGDQLERIQQAGRCGRDGSVCACGSS